MMPTCTSPSKLSSSYQTVVTLLLIENSSSMSTVWGIFRDRYLPNVLRKIEGTGPSHSTFFIETSSLSHSFTIPSPQLKSYQGAIDGLDFEHGSRNNKISVEKIHSSLDMLASIAAQTPLVALHLVIVAASTPFIDSTHFDHTSRTPWVRISERMAQDDINCHLILKEGENMWLLKILFEETLRLRSRREASPPSNINPSEVIIRLTETHANSPCREVSPGVHTRPPLRRNSTYPLDSGAAKSGDGHEGTSQGELPSLVTQLQQRHGLTKKKVYGIKPPRMPFFRERDDPPFDPYRRAALPFPAALTDPSLSSPVTLTPGGRCPSQSRVDRAVRLGHRSPTDTTSRHWHQPTSRLSSPENEASSSSITSTAAKPIHAANYELPLPVTEPAYRPFPPADQPFAYTPNVYDTDVDSPSRHWANTAQNAYYPVAGGFTPSPPSENVYINQITASRDSSPISQQPLNNTSTRINSVVQPGPLPSTSSRSQSHRDIITSLHASTSSSSSSTASSTSTNPKDDEPFTFGPEYIAATAAMFRQEVLPAYPEYSQQLSSHPYGPSLSGKAVSDSGASYTLGTGTGLGGPSETGLPYFPPNKAGQLYAMKYNAATPRYHHYYPQRQVPEMNTMGITPMPMMTTNLEYPPPIHSHIPTYSSGSSSLTGWAG